MAQRRRTSSLPPAFDSRLRPPLSHLQRRTGEKLTEGRTFSNLTHRSQSPASVSRTAMGPISTQKSQDRSARIRVAPEENTGTRKLGRSTSRSRHDRESTKPETDTTRDPGITDPDFEKANIKAPANGTTGQRQERLRRESEEASSTNAAQIGAQHGASKPRSLNTDFVSDGGSTAVPEAQMCLYIIKQGRSHAIPHRLEPGLRDTLSSAFRLQQSQKSVYKKLASLSPENIAALQAVLDDGESGPQTRRLVQLIILQKSPFQYGGSHEPSVMAVVEDPYPQRSWTDHAKIIQGNDGHFSRLSTDARPVSQEDHSHPMSKELGPQFRAYAGSSGRTRLVKRRPHCDIQDVSRDMMDRDDYQAALTTYRVWIIQQHPSLKQSESEPQSWAKCTVTEDVRSNDDIAQRLLVLDNKPPSVNMKRLSLRPDQQTQISRLQETVVDDETNPEYQWSLRQLDLIRSKSKPFQLVPTITAIFVYLARTPRAHVNLQRIFEVQHMHEDDDRQTYLSTTNGPQSLSTSHPASNFNNKSPLIGKSKYQSRLRTRSPPFSPAVSHPPPPPLPPDAPHNPYGPPEGYPPPSAPVALFLRSSRYDSGHSRFAPPPLLSSESAFSSKQQDFTDKSSDSDSDWSSAYISGDEDSTSHPKKHETRILAPLVSKRVLRDLGYPWVEEGNTIVVFRPLDEDQVEYILQLSEKHNRFESNMGELKVSPTNQRTTRRNSIDGAPRPLNLRARTTDRKDNSFGGVQAPNDADHPIAVPAADTTDDNAFRTLAFQQRSLAHDPLLRRKPSELHLRSSAIARLGIPEAEARVALEASRVLVGLHRSVSDLNLDERRPFRPSEFDDMPYDLQQNKDDQIINQLFAGWTPQWDGVTQGNDPVGLGVRHEIMGEEGSVDVEGQNDRSESSMPDDGSYDSSDHSSFEDLVLRTRPKGNIPGAELHATSPAKQDSRFKSPHEELVANLAARNDSTAEIERLEEQLSMLKFMRNAKRTERELLSKRLNEKTEHKTGERPTAGPAQMPTQANTATTKQNNITDSPFVPKKSAARRRVAMDNVQDEAGTKNLYEKNRLAKTQDGDEGDKMPVRAPSLPGSVEASEAEPEWSHRVPHDSTASSEATEPAGAETALESQSRRDVRAAQREALKRKGSERGRRLIKGVPDPKLYQGDGRRTSRVR